MRKTHEFRKVYSTGRKIHVSSATIFLLDNGLTHTRLGVTATRKVGGAVKRNRLKRRVREVFRRNLSRIAGSTDIVVNVKPAAHSLAYSELESQILGAVDRGRRRR